MLTNNLSLRNKSLRARNKVVHVEIFARGCEACAAICCDCDLWKPITQNTKKFLFSEKRARLRTKKYNNDFRKVGISNSNTKDLAINLTMIAYAHRQNAVTFARANSSDSDLLRAQKHLIKTRIYNFKI